MKVPCCKAYCVGEVTAWGKQFLGELQSQNVIEAAFQSPQEFLDSSATPISPILVLVENTPESKKTLTKLRSSGHPLFWIWYGRAFSKEDYAFALENRAYAVFEHARAENKPLIETLGRVAEHVEAGDQYDQIVHSLKSLLLQSEEDEATRQLVSEIKTAVTKLDGCRARNELAGQSKPVQNDATPPVPTGDPGTLFHRTQDFSDALNTVHDLERTGALFIRGDLPGMEGRVEFIQGKIVSASAGDARGMKAIYRMFLWDKPRFLFTRKNAQDCFVEEVVSLSMKHLCQEGEELKRRFERVRREIPPSELILELEPSSLHPGSKLPLEDFSTLASVVEFGKISQVIDNNQLPDVSLFESLIRLKKQNMIRVALS